MKAFTSYKLKNMTLKNRIVVPPMCMYSSDDEGMVKDFHISHYTSYAIGGAGLIIVEATGIEPKGRISSNDLGLWSDEQIPGLASIVSQSKKYGSKIGIQLSHAGRKCEANVDTIVAPSALPFSENRKVPLELTKKDILNIIDLFKSAAIRAEKAGFDIIEIHGAHGYLINEFLSPLSNLRSDEYGGSLENRTRFLVEILKTVREVWPSEKPISVRLSATDHKEGGITIDDTINIVKLIKEYIDIAHISSGGIEHASIDIYPGYQVQYAEAVKKECNIPTIAVGLIKEYDQVEEILSNNRADLVALAREMLRNPNWVLNNAYKHNIKIDFPEQLERAYR